MSLVGEAYTYFQQLKPVAQAMTSHALREARAVWEPREGNMTPGAMTVDGICTIL